MHILVTGGAGFIGRHVVDVALDRGHDVRVLDSLRPDVHRVEPAPLPDGVDLQVGAVRDAAAVDRSLVGIEGVCHLAAKVGLGVAVSDLPDYADTNDHGSAALLAGVARADVGRVALASSMVVYGEGRSLCSEHGLVTPAARRESDLAAGQFEPPCPVCGRPLQPALVGEDTPLDPRNAYAATKAAQEYLTTSWALATGGRAGMMRYHNVYGPGLPRDTPYAGVAAIFLSAARRGDAPQVFEDGAQRRDFVHVRDVATATVLALEATADQQAPTRAYNAGSGTVRTVGDMAAALARAVGAPAPVVTGRYRLGDVRHITADSARARAELGWTPAVDFEDGMRELAATA